MARPRKPEAMVLDQRVTVRLTAAEYAAVTAAATRDGVTVASLARTRITGADPGADRSARARLSASRVDPGLLVQVIHIGRNINQVARRANGLGLVDFDTITQLRGIRGLLEELLEQHTDRHHGHADVDDPRDTESTGGRDRPTGPGGGDRVR